MCADRDQPATWATWSHAVAGIAVHGTGGGDGFVSAGRRDQGYRGQSAGGQQVIAVPEGEWRRRLTYQMRGQVGVATTWSIGMHCG
eukprot:498429-Pyramimonas_sp.AAC.1